MGTSSLLLKLALPVLSLIASASASDFCFIVQASETNSTIDNQFIEIQLNSTDAFYTGFNTAPLYATVFKLDPSGGLVAVNGPGVFQPEDYPLVPAGFPDTEILWYTATEFKTSPYTELQPICSINQDTGVFTCSAGGISTLEVCYGDSVHFVTNPVVGCGPVTFTAIPNPCPSPPVQTQCIALKASVPETTLDNSYVSVCNCSGSVSTSLNPDFEWASIFKIGGSLGGNLLVTSFDDSPYYGFLTGQYDYSYFIHWDTADRLSLGGSYNYYYQFALSADIKGSDITIQAGYYGGNTYYSNEDFAAFQVCADNSLRFYTFGLPETGCVAVTLSYENVTCPDPDFYGNIPPPPAPTSTLPTSAPTVHPVPVTSTTPSQTPTSVPQLSNPPKVGTFTYLGCVGSNFSFSSFTKIASSPLMSNELCISACINQAYSAMSGR